MVGQGGLRDVELFEEAAGAHVLIVLEQLDDAKTVGVAERLEVRGETRLIEATREDARSKAADALFDVVDSASSSCVDLASALDEYIEWHRGGKLKKALGWRTIRQFREELAVA